MKKFLLLLLFPSIAGAQAPPGMRSSLHAGVNFSRLYTDSLATSASAYPLAGAGVSFPLSEALRMKPGVQYSLRGSKSEHPHVKFRNEYIDLNLLLEYSPTPQLQLEIGGQYALLMSSKKIVLSGFNASGTESVPVKGYASQLEAAAGILFPFQQNASIGLRYCQGLSRNSTSSIQAHLHFSFNQLHEDNKGGTFKDLQAAAAAPLEVKKLVLHRVPLAVFPAEICAMENLEELILEGNGLTVLPEDIACLRKLKKLSVAFNDLESLPASIGNLKGLYELDVRFNKIKRIPPEIGKLSSLNFLYIGKNTLNELTGAIGNLTELKELDLTDSGPGLRIPGEVANLRKLEVLYLDRTIQFPYSITSMNPRFRIVLKESLPGEENINPEMK